MLTTILNNIPVPKFIVIQDSLVLQGKNILYSIIRAHLNLKTHIVHYFAFESYPDKIQSQLVGDKICIYDYLTDNNGWIEKSNTKTFGEQIDANKNISGIIVIDSLSLFILEYGLCQAYKLLYKLINQAGIIQVVSLLHTDTLENELDTLKYFEHITTLNLKLELVNTKKRVNYRYKRQGGKLVKKVEEYYFEGNIFRTKALEKVDPKVLLGTTKSETMPENLSTFKISLDENEKKSRDQLTLPYTAKSIIDQSKPAGGDVIYNLDDDDDWDNEDPDDDLDI